MEYHHHRERKCDSVCRFSHLGVTEVADVDTAREGISFVLAKVAVLMYI